MTKKNKHGRLIDADALIADCQLAQKQADRHGREFANAFYSGGGSISTEWWCVEDMIENAPTIEPEIIRCKDCYHYPNKYADCPMIGWARNENDFCSKAERKNDD